MFSGVMSGKRAGPLGLAVRRVAVHVGVDGGDLAHRRPPESAASASGRNCRLVPDLHRRLPRPLVRRAHALGVVDGERHGLFLVDVLAGFQRSDEMLGVQVLRRGDQDGVDVLSSSKRR